ncbi:FAD-dependent oxidoreductase [bacterium]|jgi:dihydrolipoamide dehydrogenase|nr:FAD-dependent oxidoreductase [bacterium]
MSKNYDLVIIGAGSGGLVVASGAAGLGASVALIEKHKMGGDCLNYGCVPSKAFLKPAHLAKDIDKASELGLSVGKVNVDVKEVMNYVRSVIKEIEPHDSRERYEGLGVDVFEGSASLKDRHSVSVIDESNNETIIKGKKIVIATGAESAVPPIPGLKEIDFLTNKSIFNLEKLPEHLIILGGGPIGLELGQGFAHLGSKVTVIDMLPSLFPNDDPEVGPLMEKVLKEDGLSLKLSASINRLSEKDGQKTVLIKTKEGIEEEIVCDQVLVSLGRRPNSKGLNLEEVGIVVSKRGFIECNKSMQTSVSNIYACGDIVGPYQFTHMAGYQAGIILRHSIFKMPAKVNYRTVPWVTYTRPEVAHVGLTEQMAKKDGLLEKVEKVDLKSIDRAKADHDREGFLKFIIGKRNRLLGVTIVGQKAGEMIGIGALAIQKELKASEFLSMVFPYPTQSEIYKFASLNLAKQGFKPWMKTLIKKIFL